MRIQGPDGWFIGPFETQAEAEVFEARIVEMVHENMIAKTSGDVLGLWRSVLRVLESGGRLIDTAKGPGVVLRAAEEAAKDLKGRPGKYELTVNVDPKGKHHVRYQPPARTFGQDKPDDDPESKPPH